MLSSKIWFSVFLDFAVGRFGIGVLPFGGENMPLSFSNVLLFELFRVSLISWRGSFIHLLLFDFDDWHCSQNLVACLCKFKSLY
jgi:hypothetical protein